MLEDNYKIEIYHDKIDWLKARCIGGTDLAKLVDKVAKWGNFIDLYDKLVYGEEQEIIENELMIKGKKSEENIKNLFLINHPELKRINPENELWLVRRKDYPEITLSPDTLVKKADDLGYIEIKYKEIYNEDNIPDYMINLKEREPQYYWQNVDYFISMNNLKFGYLVIAFAVKKKNKETGIWEFDKYIIDSLYMTREYLKNDIDLGEKNLIDFIENNLRPKIRPKTKLKGLEEEKIEWSKLSNIVQLRR